MNVRKTIVNTKLALDISSILLKIYYKGPGEVNPITKLHGCTTNTQHRRDRALKSTAQKEYRQKQNFTKNKRKYNYTKRDERCMHFSANGFIPTESQNHHCSLYPFFIYVMN